MGLYRRDGSPLWWCSFTVAGKQVRVSTGTADKNEAKTKMAEFVAAKKVPIKGTVGKLLDGLIADYEINGQDGKHPSSILNNGLRVPFFRF